MSLPKKLRQRLAELKAAARETRAAEEEGEKQCRKLRRKILRKKIALVSRSEEFAEEFFQAGGCAFTVDVEQPPDTGSLGVHAHDCLVIVLKSYLETKFGDPHMMWRKRVCREFESSKEGELIRGAKEAPKDLLDCLTKLGLIDKSVKLARSNGQYFHRVGGKWRRFWGK